VRYIFTCGFSYQLSVLFLVAVFKKTVTKIISIQAVVFLRNRM
jgi:hypothetical protein